MAVVDLGRLTPDQGFHVTGGGFIYSVGSSLSVGDINGDGIDDLVIGTITHEFGTASNSYIVYGSEGGWSDVSLSSGSPDIVKTLSLYKTAGDVNGDGFDDIIQGTVGRAAYYGGYYMGGASVSFGGPDGATNSGFGIVGATEGAGYTVGAAGDINGDGFDDIFVGDPYADGDNGSAYVIFGKAGGFADIDLATLSAADGFSINGEANGDGLGRYISAAGDVNGDGFDDLIVGANRNGDGGNISGAAYVIFGKASGFSNLDLATLSATDGFRIIGDAVYDQAGSSVASAGDINGDGYDDLIVGAIGADPGGDSSGAAYVIFGKATGFADIDLGALSATDGFKISGEAAADNAGRSVSSAGDFNGDGFDDLIVGAPGDSPYGTHSGAAYVIFGKAGGFTDIDLSSLGESDGFKIIGADTWGGAGMSVASAGDLNNDGFDDLMISAPAAGVGGMGEVYILYGHADTGVVKAGTDAADSLAGGNLDDTLDGRGGDDILNGLGGADMLIGGSGNDMLDGGAGADTLAGGTGNDTYVIDSANDIVVERSAEGTDLVKSSVGYTLGAYLENLTLLGAGAISGTGNSLNNIITGNSGANLLDGKAGADTINGGGGNDTLLGGDGIDILDGGTGNDTINGGNGIDTATYFDAAAGVTVKLIAGAQATIGAGSDTLVGIENLTGSAFADKLTGDAAANVLNGNDGNDVLSGLGGNDHLNGGVGNDVLDGGGGDDVLAGNTGVDTASYASATAGVTVSLVIATAQTTGFGHDTLSGIENLTGSNFNDTLSGNTSANAIDGGTGNDRIDGGGGSDTLTGGAGADNFVFSSTLNGLTNVDKITDFVAVDDTILLSSTIFAAAGPNGTLSASAFHAGTAAADADDRIIYNQSTGFIYYDADGNGAGAKVLFAKVTPGTVLTNADFSVAAVSGSAVSGSAASAEAIRLPDGPLSLHLPQDDFTHPDRHVHDRLYDARDLYGQWLENRDFSGWFDLRHHDVGIYADFLLG